jgi:hemoglobin
MCKLATPTASSTDAPGPTLPKTSLFQRLGGVAAVRAAVDEFYKRILQDPALMRFFDETSLPVLKMHQVQFLKIAFVAIPDDLDVGKLLLDKHQRLFEMGLDGSHFDLVAGHFIGALNHLSVPQALIDESVGIVASLRPVFVEGANTFGPKATAVDDVEEAQEEEAPAPKEEVKKASTLASKLGGVAALKAAVEGLYQRVLADSDLAEFFEGMDMTSLKMHQIAFMNVAFTHIPEDLDVIQLMKDKHAGLIKKGLAPIHFDKVA